MVCGTGGGIGVPELGLEQLPAGGVEAAGVGHGAGVVAAEGEVGAEIRVPGEDGRGENAQQCCGLEDA